MLRAALAFFFLVYTNLLSAQIKEIKGPSLLYCNFVKNNFVNNEISNLHSGLRISYFKGLHHKFDLGVSMSGSFTDAALKQTQVTVDKDLFLQFQLGGRYRLIAGSPLQPFLSAGIGTALYSSGHSFFVAPGAGLQANLKSIYFLLQVQYQQPLSAVFNQHVSYSFGIGGQLSKRKTKQLQVSLPSAIISNYDRDNDGIADSTDRCPDTPGLVPFHGCPDSDGDGIRDEEDRCPTIKGEVAYQGCPPPDSDGDGITDDLDSCVSIPGFVKYHGCPVPDTDGDGINDEEDICVYMPGVRENKGCPAIEQAILDSFNKAAKNILFATGSHKLLPTSFKALDAVVNLLQKNEKFQLLVEGHTDNVGGSVANQVLSEKRAAAVVAYLVSKGVEPSRIRSVGYGAAKPAFNNTSVDGRAGNRRVVLKPSY